MEVNQSEEDLNLLNLPKLKNESDGADLEKILGKDEANLKTFPDEAVFKYPADGMERTAYENILKANRETIKSLRNQVQEGNAKIAELTAELEAKNKEV